MSYSNVWFVENSEQDILDCYQTVDFELRNKGIIQNSFFEWKLNFYFYSFLYQH